MIKATMACILGLEFSNMKNFPIPKLFSPNKQSFPDTDITDTDYLKVWENWKGGKLESQV